MKKSPIRHRLEQFACSLLARWASLTARLLPFGMLWWVADRMAEIAMAATPRRQRLADANLAAAFPELTAAQRRQVRRRSVCNIARTMLELLKLPALSGEQVAGLIESPDLASLRELCGSDRGVMFITAHFGNWELLGAFVSEFVKPMTVVARDADHGITAALINRARESHGLKVVGRDDTRQVLRLLNSGGLLGILPDQHAAQGGVLLDFLGRPAWTFTGPAVLASRTGARVVPVFLLRDFHGPFRLQLQPEVHLVQTDDREADVVENTRRINAALEQAIRAHPDNWLWLHNRWKDRKLMSAAG